MAEVGKLSASKIAIYKGCSLAYYLNYVAHEKVPTNGRFVFGGGVHYMLEKFYKINYKTPDSFAGFWNHYWGMLISGDNLKGKQKRELKIKNHKYYGKDKKTGKRIEKILRVGNHVDLGDEDPIGLFFGYMRLGQNILKNFYRRHISEKDSSIKNRKPPEEKEYAFGVKKVEPFKINGHLVIGYMDRIDEKDGKWWISDYKTDKKSPEKDSFVLHKHPQFTLYSYVFRKLFNKKEKAILYYHLRSNKIFETHRSEKDYDYLKRLLDEVSEGIDKDIFVPFYGFHCGFCDYKVACEKYSIDHRGGPRIDLGGKIKRAKEFKEWDGEIPDWLEMQTEER